MTEIAIVMDSQAAVSRIRHLLITRHDKMGDFLLALPLCKALKLANPSVYLTMLVSHRNQEFAKSLEFIDNVLVYGPEFWKTLESLKKIRPDASISCYIDTRLGCLLYLAGIPIRISPATKFAQIFFNRRLVQRRSRVEKTEWQYNLDLGRVLVPYLPLDFSPPLLNRRTIEINKRILFHPGSGGSSDGNIKIRDYLRIAKTIFEKSGVEIIFSFGPDDREVREIVKREINFPAVLLERNMSLIEFSRYVAQSCLVVSTSTGPMHLAGAYNVPTVSFFGTSKFASSNRWATISERNQQHNFPVGPDYSEALISKVETTILELLQ